ncbi:MAG: hypothetical protein E6K78_01460 [Candidatus Eisenbacteria bacterium]|uniref:Tetratricopeptide repeat protein n=1 Tax=Eiseniibacteriota bacterium TaxID=2212470 RepID=A0A538TXK2_UNCEI|nr:MAG: hypothetical protein E6K78_01460 [Candidatus Eisenbacteria bacterium]
MSSEPTAASGVAAAAGPEKASSPPPVPPLPRWAWVVLVVFAGGAACYRSADENAWFHLAAGRSILTHGWPTRETWCWIAYGQRPWLPGWAHDVTLYGLYALGGNVAIALWRAAWAAVTMALGLTIVRRLGAASWAGALVAILVLAVARPQLEPRPEAIVPALVLLAIALFEGARSSGRDRTRWLVPGQVLWTNVHSSWALGPFLAWSYSFAESWREGSAPKDTASSDAAPSAARVSTATTMRWRQWLVLGLVLWAASALTPTPLLSLATPLRFLSGLLDDPAEGRAPDLRVWTWAEDHRDPFTALLALAFLGTLLGSHRAQRASPALAIFALIALGLGVMGVRFRALAAWACLGPLAVALSGPAAPWRRVAQGLVVVTAGAAGAAWLVVAPQFRLGVTPLPSSAPVRAVAVADSLRLSGPVLNTAPFGGYLLWARGDSHPPFVDGRGRGNPGTLSLLSRSEIDPVALDSLVRAWDFRYAIVEPPPGSATTLATLLSRELNWALIFYDDDGLLFVRRKDYPALEPLAYRFVTPDEIQMRLWTQRTLTDPGLEKLFEAELERARRESSRHARASWWLAEVALAHGDGTRAVAMLNEVERLAPETRGLALKQGMSRRLVGDLAGARAAFRRALANPDDAETAQEELQLLK